MKWCLKREERKGEEIWLERIGEEKGSIGEVVSIMVRLAWPGRCRRGWHAWVLWCDKHTGRCMLCYTGTISTILGLLCYFRECHFRIP